MTNCPKCGTVWPDGRPDQLCAQCIINSLPEATPRSLDPEVGKEIREFFVFLLTCTPDMQKALPEKLIAMRRFLTLAISNMMDPKEASLEIEKIGWSRIYGISHIQNAIYSIKEEIAKKSKKWWQVWK
jgi:hypothetical protein